MMTDPIADLATRIRNALSIKRAETSIPHSKIKAGIAEIPHVAVVTKADLGAYPAGVRAQAVTHNISLPKIYSVPIVAICPVTQKSIGILLQNLTGFNASAWQPSQNISLMFAQAPIRKINISFICRKPNGMLL